MMLPTVTDKTLPQFAAEISDQLYAMSGATLAASAAQTVALGETCMQLSFDHQPDKLDWQQITSRIERMSFIKTSLLDWCDRDARTRAEYFDLGPEQAGLNRHQALCDGAAEISRLSIEAAIMLQEFRPLVFEPIKSDLEITILLLKGTASSTLKLLESYLRNWSNPTLSERYAPLQANLKEQFAQITPLKRSYVDYSK